MGMSFEIGANRQGRGEDERFFPTPFEDRLKGEDDLKIYLIDGTYELFRHYYAVPSAKDKTALKLEQFEESRFVIGDDEGRWTHIAVATDHVIESFRNALWPGYKTGEGDRPGFAGAVSAAGGNAFSGRCGGVADGGV